MVGKVQDQKWSLEEDQNSLDILAKRSRLLLRKDKIRLTTRPEIS